LFENVTAQELVVLAQTGAYSAVQATSSLGKGNKSAIAKGEIENKINIANNFFIGK
jgi:hypothetical protein